MRDASDWIFPLFTDHVIYDRSMARLSDVHLYTGSKCNRQCDFCIVSGRPDGWYEPMTEASLEAALALTTPDGTIKFYGGEPTIDIDNLIWAMAFLRSRGFSGWFTIFSNGVRADRLLRALESDVRVDAVLNFSILHGEDAEPLPPAALAQLRAFALAHPNRIYSSHAGVFPFGRGADFADHVGHDHVTDRMHTSIEKKMAIGQLDASTAAEVEARGFRVCPRCRPVVGTDGKHHACPFAVESKMPHFDLGTVGDPDGAVLERFQAFLDWIDDTLEPEAERLQTHPCLVCTHGLEKLPTYRIASKRADEPGEPFA